MKASQGIFLLLGSNLGNRTLILENARKEIGGQIGKIVNASLVYQTEPWGISDQPSFFNQVLNVNSGYTPERILKIIQEIENRIGKVKLGKWRERLIDIDLLYFHQHIINEEKLVVPHPEIQNRRFTLVPMCELDSQFLHPVFGKTQKQLLEECNDQLSVTPLEV